MVKKTAPFFGGCSSRTCVEVKQEVAKDYDRDYYRKHKKRPPQPSPKGGVKTTLMEPARVRIIGERGRYPAEQHGLAIEARRCREFRYSDRQGELHKPTCTEKKIFNIPERTVRCYKLFSGLLEAVSRGKKGAPPTTTNKILALLGCNQSGVGTPRKIREPLTSYLIAAATGLEHNAVRKTMEKLVESKKVTSSMPWIDVVDEKQNRLAPTYQAAFDDFVLGESEARKWTGFRRLFGEQYVPASVKLPEAEPYRYTGVLQMKFPKKKMGKKALARARKEAEEWKRRTMIVPPSYGGALTKAKIQRSKKVPRKKDVYKLQAMERESRREMRAEQARAEAE